MEPHTQLYQHHLGTRLTTWQIVVGSSNASSPMAHACLWVTSISTGVVVLRIRLNEKCGAWNLNAVGVQRRPARWNVSQKAFDSSISWETWKQFTWTNKKSEHLGAVVVVVEEEEEVSSTLADCGEPPPSTIFKLLIKTSWQQRKNKVSTSGESLQRGSLFTSPAWIQWRSNRRGSSLVGGTPL